MLQRIIKLIKRGAHILALTKKRRCWLKHASREAMGSIMQRKETGSTDSINRKSDCSHCNSFMMRDRDCAVKLIGTCSKLEVEMGTNNAQRHVKEVDN